SIRPGVRTLQFPRVSESDVLDVAMVVEPAGPELGELSARVRAAHPDVPLVVIAPRFDERAIEVAAGVEATAIVSSPCEPGALSRVLDDHERKVRYAGRCRGIETAELLRLLTAATDHGVLHVASAAGSGAIHLDEGQPVHAHTANNRGVDAVREMLGWADGKATWIAGRSASARTIVAPIDGLIERQLPERPTTGKSEDAPADVIDKLDRLAQTPDVLAAYLLRNTEVIAGRNSSDLDDAAIGRALSRLSQVFHDMDDQQGDGMGSEIQATVGDHRLVVDRLGPSRLGFQIGVVVRQATPVCKSLRRLLRQIDRSFRKSLLTGSRPATSASEPGIPAFPSQSNFHRVA
ncbi:MAG TPA: DUF4388 domain-containing protein, partial [Enhygromyxa sp.]|nr:DUF4388 domain-containing protein [Enhygromyxa sp.]